MENFAGVDDRLQPGAGLARFLNRGEKLQQLGLVASVFLQRLAERQVPQGAGRRQAGGVGRHEGEGEIRVAAIFRQIEMHASDEAPAAITLF